MVETVAIILAGLAAGCINTVVGSGSLVTFPTLLALGYPPIVANVSNTIGLVPGSISGAIGYRRELAGQRSRMWRFGVVSAAGGLTGGVLLLALPPNAFNRLVPFLLLIACTLVALQPRLSKALQRRRPQGAERSHWLLLLVGGAAIYGGYFGAAQSVIFMALFAIFIQDDLQRLNGLKNVVAGVVNIVAAILFLVLAPVAWQPAVLIGIGSTIGGQLGASVGRRLSPSVLRLGIVLVGASVAFRMLLP